VSDTYALFERLKSIATEHSKEVALKTLIVADIRAHYDLEGKYVGDSLSQREIYRRLKENLRRGVAKELCDVGVPCTALAYIITQVLRREGATEEKIFDLLMCLEIPSENGAAITRPFYGKIRETLCNKVGIFSDGTGEISC